ncbi:hypothetical protein GCM10027614_40730 [Micromonospora vulcania]
MIDVIPVASPHLDEDDITAAVRVLRSGALVQGREVAAFEDEFSDLVDGRHCIAVNSGTTALWLPLLGLGIGPGDEVIIPAFTFAATAAAVRLTGATPVFADIDPVSFCLDPAAAEAVTSRTAAIIPVHLFGHPADLGALLTLARRHGIALIEDAAQAHAATLHARPVGTFGTAAAFSFYPTKNMQSVEGGMITTADPGLARTLRLLRNVGMETRYCHEIVGTNGRLNDVFAAIGRTQLRKLPARTAAAGPTPRTSTPHWPVSPAYPHRPPASAPDTCTTSTRSASTTAVTPSPRPCSRTGSAAPCTTRSRCTAARPTAPPPTCPTPIPPPPRCCRCPCIPGSPAPTLTGLSPPFSGTPAESSWRHDRPRATRRPRRTRAHGQAPRPSTARARWRRPGRRRRPGR